MYSNQFKRSFTICLVHRGADRVYIYIYIHTHTEWMHGGNLNSLEPTWYVVRGTWYVRILKKNTLYE